MKTKEGISWPRGCQWQEAQKVRDSCHHPHCLQVLWTGEGPAVRTQTDVIWQGSPYTYPEAKDKSCIAPNPQLTPVSNTREKRPNQHHSGSINLCDNSKEAPQQPVRGALSLGCSLQFRSTTVSGTSKTQRDKEYGITSWTNALDFLKVKSLSRVRLFGLFGQREHIGKWKTALKWSLTRRRALFSNATASPSWSEGLGMGLSRL